MDHSDHSHHHHMDHSSHGDMSGADMHGGHGSGPMCSMNVSFSVMGENINMERSLRQDNKELAPFPITYQSVHTLWRERDYRLMIPPAPL